MLPKVVIFYTGDNADDEAFAKEIEAKLGSFSEPKLMDVDELERQDRAGTFRPEEYEGVPIYILSPTLLQQPEYRNKLIASTPGQNTYGRNFPWSQCFYICHNITLQQIKDDYPDLENLRFEAMIGDQKNLPELIGDLKKYLADTPQSVSLAQRISEFFRIVVAFLFYSLGFFCTTVYSFSFISSLGLLYLLIFKFKQPTYELIFISHVLFAAGYSFSRIPFLDFWEYLGSAWKIYDFSEDRANYMRNGHPDSEYTDRVHGQAVFKWMSIARVAGFKQLIILCFLLIPALLSVDGANMIVAGICAFFVGLIMPIFWSISWRYFDKWRAWGYAMSDHEIDRIQKIYKNTRPLIGVSRWTVHRPWSPRNPWILGAFWIKALQVNIFISHARKDDKYYENANHESAAQVLYQIVTNLHLPCFLDEKAMPSKFATLRSQLASELLECTHFFLVLGPKVKESQTVRQEIRTVMQRWYNGLEPAIICVVEPEVAEILLEDNTVPEINLLLRKCPKLTYAEASDPDVIRHIIRQRCRHGLLQDWFALVSPMSTLRRYVSNEISSMSKIN